MATEQFRPRDLARISDIIRLNTKDSETRSKETYEMYNIPVVNPVVCLASEEDCVVFKGHLFIKAGRRRIIDAFHTST